MGFQTWNLMIEFSVMSMVNFVLGCLARALGAHPSLQTVTPAFKLQTKIEEKQEKKVPPTLNRVLLQTLPRAINTKPHEATIPTNQFQNP